MKMPSVSIAALLSLVSLLYASPSPAQDPAQKEALPAQTMRQSNCPFNAISHSLDCTLGVFTFDRPNAGGHGDETAHRTELNAVGPGSSVGNGGGWRVQHIDFDFLNVASRGISQGRTLVLNKHAVGDTMGTYDYVFSDGGTTARSDEAIKGEVFNMGETDNYFHGTVASTTGTGDTSPALTFVSGNNWTTDGAPLLNITKGNISGHITGPSTPLPGSTYLNTFPVDNTLPLTTAWGICNKEIPFNHQAEVSSSFTCDVTLKQGRFSPKGLVCVTGPSYPEQAPITAASEPSGGTQSITISVRNTNEAGATILQGGPCGQYISFDANLAFSGYRSSYFAFGALDAHHLIYGMDIMGSLKGNTLPMQGQEAEQFGVAGFNGYHLYPGCEVITNRTQGASPVCEPNAVPWQVSDQVEAPHNVAVNVQGHGGGIHQNTPSNGWISSGDMINLHGFGVAGHAFIGRITRNSNPNTFYRPFGGPLEGPEMHVIQGYFSDGFVFGVPPGALFRMYADHTHPAAPITLFALPGGDIKWDPTSGTLLAKTSLHGTTSNIGGRPLALGTCTTGTANIPGANKSMVPVTVASATGAPGFSPAGAFQVNAQVTANDTVTVSVCAILPGTPQASTYIVSLQ